MHIRALLLLLFLHGFGLAAASPPAPGIAGAPGALPFESLDLFPSKDLTTEINLEGPLLQLIASATSEDDPEFSRLVAGLHGIRVQVASLAAADPGKVRAKLDRTLHWLETQGWSTVVRTRENNEETYIYTRQQNGAIVGLVVLSFELGKEASVVNIVGRLDPAQLGRLGRTIHVPQLEKVPSKDKDKPKEPKQPG
jgi:Domain of unknown function (DUF4252)